MSFIELAEARGTSKASAIKLVRRHRWRRQRDNEGHVRALVPLPWQSGEGDGEADSTPPGTADSLGDISREINAFERAMTMLAQAKDAEIATLRAGLDHTLAQLADEKARGDRLDAALAAERARADALRDRQDGAETQARAAEEAAEALRQADATRRARSLLARLRAAWRGQ